MLYLLQGDGRPFWKLVVSEATGCSNEDYFEEVYKVTFLDSRLLFVIPSVPIYGDSTNLS